MTSDGHFLMFNFFLALLNKNWAFDGQIKSLWRTGEFKITLKSTPTKITKQFSSLVFLIIDCIFTLSRFLKEKNEQGLSRIQQSSVISNLKCCKNIKHWYLLIKGPTWLLKVIFGGCVFLSFSTKIGTFWSISQRYRRFFCQ